MRIGVPKEIKPQENRIGLTPDSVKVLTSNGHKVLVENRIGSTRKAEKELGFKADVLIRDGLHKTIDWRKIIEI